MSRRLPAGLRDALSEVLGGTVAQVESVSGGDINDAYRVWLSAGGVDRQIFVKTHDNAPARMFSCEADGLAWLAEADALRVPRVLAVRDRDSDGPSFLALEFIRPGGRARDFDEYLGRGLAGLHAHGADGFGLHTGDNFIATLAQDNRPMHSWPAFYASRRLQPLCARAVDAGVAPAAWIHQFERLADRLPTILGPDEPPARLHGDLWSGNVHTDERGMPVIIDPAVYGGHREIDLAMLALFGGMNARILAAYHERYPLAPGYEERTLLYQLYPLLVHVNLFGGSYVGSVARALNRYL